MDLKLKKKNSYKGRNMGGGWILLALVSLFAFSSCGGIIGNSDAQPNLVINLSTRDAGSLLPTALDKENCSFNIYIDGVQVASGAKNSFEVKLPYGARVTIRIEAVLGGQVIAEGEEQIVVSDSLNNMSLGLKKAFAPSPNSVAHINRVEYADFTTAFNAVKAGETLTLLKDVNITASSVLQVTKDLTLDLNGFTITKALTNQVFTVKDATFTLADTSTAKSGKITGVTGGTSGAIFLSATQSTKFIMTGGSISGNTSTGGGGAIQMGDNSQFEMTGGTISENTTTKNGGGAIYAKSGANIVITGGIIENNTAKGLSGGGIYLDVGATLTMTGGTITNNDSASPGKAIFAKSNGTFTVGNNSNQTSCDSIVNGVVVP